MRRCLLALALMAQLALAADPFQAGAAFGHAHKAGVAQGVTSGQAQALVPGYNAAPPEAANFGAADLAAPRQTKIAGCATTSLDPKSRQDQECLAVNLTQQTPSQKGAFSLTPSSAIVARGDAVVSNPTAYAGNLDGSFSGCQTTTSTTPARYSTETCTTMRGVQSQQCTMGREVNIDSDSNFQCEQTVNSYETNKCKRSYVPVIASQVGCNAEVLVYSATTSTFGGIINERYYCVEGTKFRKDNTNYTYGSSGSYYIYQDVRRPWALWWDSASYSVLECDSSYCYDRDYRGNGSVYRSITLDRPTRPAITGSFNMTNNCAALEVRAQ